MASTTDLARPLDIDRPYSASPTVNAKLTTSAGISVSYVAPALPTSSPPSVSESSGWSTLEEDLEEELTAEESYKSFLAPYGQVLLDPDLDLEPQIMQEEEVSPSPRYSTIYDSDGNVIKDDDYPSSWDEEEDDMSNKIITKLKVSQEEPSWSDIGQPVNSSFEFWKTENKLKAVSKPKLYDTKYQHNNKYASDSNIKDAVDMTQPGLRKIPKENCYTTTSSETTARSPEAQTEDDHLYCSIQDDSKGEPIEENIYETVDFDHPESGFFSYVAVNRHAFKPIVTTCIPVNQDYSTSSSDCYESMSVNKVTVNGKLWINPTNTDSSTNEPNVVLTNQITSSFIFLSNNLGLFQPSFVYISVVVFGVTRLFFVFSSL